MFLTKLIALVVFVSWLGATGERLYDCIANGFVTPPQANDEQTQTGRWSISQLRW
ncbi:MAG: hypothetical protein JSS01_07370 [Proteobacteria bacterium]|nr:hypothetical protein [Pseudomonadota bacterium]